MSDVRAKYDQLEAKFVERRTTTKEELAQFMEENVWRKWAEFRNHRLRLEARLKHSHDVSITLVFGNCEWVYNVCMGVNNICVLI